MATTERLAWGRNAGRRIRCGPSMMRVRNRRRRLCQSGPDRVGGRMDIPDDGRGERGRQRDAGGAKDCSVIDCNRKKSDEIGADSTRIFHPVQKFTETLTFWTARALQSAYAKSRAIARKLIASAWICRPETLLFNTRGKRCRLVAAKIRGLHINRAHGFRSILPALAAKSRTRSLGIAADRPVPVRCASLKVQASQKGVGIVFEIVPAEASRPRPVCRPIVGRRAA